MSSKGPAKYIDRRARIALDAVARAFATASEAPPPEVRDVWVRRVQPRRRELLDHVDLTYRLQNRFWARIYDFHASTAVAGGGGGLREVDVRLKLGGLVGARSVGFAARSPQGAALAQSLSAVSELSGLIRTLNLTDVRITSKHEAEQAWRIDTCGYVGSYTWNLIPPVYQAIMPTAEEVNLHLQLLAMLAQVVREQPV